MFKTFVAYFKLFILNSRFNKIVTDFAQIATELDFKRTKVYGIDKCSPIWISRFTSWKKDNLFLLIEREIDLDSLESTYSILLYNSLDSDWNGTHKPNKNCFYLSQFCELENIPHKSSKRILEPEELLDEIRLIIQNKTFKDLLNGAFWFDYSYDMRDSCTIQSFRDDMLKELAKAKLKK